MCPGVGTANTDPSDVNGILAPNARTGGPSKSRTVGWNQDGHRVGTAPIRAPRSP